MVSSENVAVGDAQVATEDVMVSVEGLTKTYGGEEGTVTAVEDIDLEVARGEFLSIVGPSGCGKTTLLHLAGGILDPTAGRVRINGIDVQTPEHQKHSVGLVFQRPVLLEWRSVISNVMLPIQIMVKNGSLDGVVEDYRDRAYELLGLVGLEGFEEAYPQELSGGMQQRVSICQSLIYDPAVLLMDEPFGSLDALTKNKLNEEFLDIWNEQQKTVLFVTHDLDEAVFLSDRIVVMSPRPGRIIDVIEVDIARPRTDETRTSEAYHDLVARAYGHFTEA
ncbi:MAG: ABC transporter ATP-binding protein [Halobacteriales archaeon]|nr:ABC transporter ATP-binding protein [Halobacteriales archaeon]